MYNEIQQKIDPFSKAHHPHVYDYCCCHVISAPTYIGSQKVEAAAAQNNTLSATLDDITTQLGQRTQELEALRAEHETAVARATDAAAQASAATTKLDRLRQTHTAFKVWHAFRCMCAHD